jgi:voltage-gated potassium channel Kch
MDIHDKLRSAKRYRWVALIAASIIGLGTVFYHFVERLSWLDSWYFSTITLTTIGYGDITPKTEIGKLFTIFYVLFGVGVIATILNIMVKGAATRRIERFKKRHSEDDASI